MTSEHRAVEDSDDDSRLTQMIASPSGGRSREGNHKSWGYSSINQRGARVAEIGALTSPLPGDQNTGRAPSLPFCPSPLLALYGNSESKAAGPAFAVRGYVSQATISFFFLLFSFDFLFYGVGMIRATAAGYLYAERRRNLMATVGKTL